HPLVVKGTEEGKQVNYGLYLNEQSGVVSFQFHEQNCSTAHWLSGSALPFGEWSYVMATYDGSQARLYVNGQVVQSSAATAGACQNDEPVRIGQGLNGTPSSPIYVGNLDDIRIYPRALSDEEVKALYQSGWQAAQTSPHGDGVNSADWSMAVPSGLEGSYRLDLRGWDVGGHFDTAASTENVWNGNIDTLAPRLTLTSTVVGSNIRYTTKAHDFNLTEDGFSSPCGDGVVTGRTYFQSPWYAALSGQTSGRAQKLYELTATCDVPTTFTKQGEVGAYDTPGLARGVALSGTLALVADGKSGLQLVDVSDAGNPRLVSNYPVGMAWAVAVVGGEETPIPTKTPTPTATNT
ncbi:MAG: hypothetical protein GXP48_08435, partial [Acidobacteria bacterium]|nr:hypothetical protein [Acidobacteriota bacterium]